MLCPVLANAQVDSTKKYYFKQRDYGKYFISDIYSPTMQVQVGMGLNLKDYNLSRTRSKILVPYNQTDFGHEIPIFLKSWYSNGVVRSKFALSMPLCARLWFDFAELTTAPILNTDYTLAPVEITYYRKIDKKLLKNIVVKFIPFFHESTHLGDELTIYRVLDSLSIRRVNVSYESAELAVSLNDPEDRLTGNWSYKIGIKALINPRKGWYSYRTIEADSGILSPTKNWIESYIQIQRQSNKGFMASNKFVRLFSLEIRNRVQFGYPFLLDTNGTQNNYVTYQNNERMRISFNVYYGYKFNFTKDLPPRFGVFLRYYTGINPYGQFRNIPVYTYYSLAFVYQN